MRNRGASIVIENNQVALIKRIKADGTYYVFPGGGIERNETPEECAKREAFEELGIEVNIKECFATSEYNGTQSFFLANQVGGHFGTGNGAEYSGKDKESYIPMWVDIARLDSMDVRPKEVASKIQSTFK